MADSLEKLKKTLYERDEIARRREHDTLSELQAYAPKKTEPASDWAASGAKLPRAPLARGVKLLIFAGVLMAAAIFAVAIYLFGGLGGAGGNNITFSLSAAESVAGGEKVVWRVVMANKNSVAIESADLVFEYPAGSQPLSKRAGMPLSSLLIERRVIGRVVPGEVLNEDFEAFIFGDVGSIAQARAVLEYQLEGSSALLHKEIFFDTLITRTPVSVAVVLPEYANIGQELEFEVLISSSAKDKMEELSAVFNFPDGFEFVSSVPALTSDTNIWRIPALSPNETQKILIKGRISGDYSENKVFRAAVGVKDERSGKFTAYGSGTGTIAFRKPLLEITALIDGQKEAVVSPGELVDVAIHWSNNLPVNARKAVLEVKIEGAAFDPARVDVEHGYFRGSDSTAIWNASSHPAFANIASGESGELKLRLMIMRTLPINEPGDVNFSVRIASRLYLEERPAGFENIDIDGRFSATAKVSSSLQLSRQGYYYYETLPNSGPLPPKVGEKTTYTIVWSLSNSTNDADEVMVSAALPPYVFWEGKFFPSGENISYDPLTSQVVWKVGRLAAGIGHLRPARTAFFQVGIVPLADQVGLSPELILAAAVTGKDSFTGAVLPDTKSPLTTRLYGDTKMDFSQFTVVE